MRDDAGPGDEASELGPGASDGGAGGLSNAGAGDGDEAWCFLLFPLVLLLLGDGASGFFAGASAGEAAGGEEAAGGVAASGAEAGGDCCTGAAAGGDFIAGGTEVGD